MTTTISNTDDIIDSRDVTARIEELEAEREALQEAVYEALERLDALREACDAGEEDAHGELSTAQAALEEWDDDNNAELAALEALAEEASGSPDWRYGETLIRDSYFHDYAEQLADDIGAIDRNAGWPCTCIDWDQAARELQMDYTAVDFDGVTYWIRS